MRIRELLQPTFESLGWLAAAIALTIGLETAISMRALSVNVDGLMFIELAKRLDADPLRMIRGHDQHPGYPALILATERTLEALGCEPNPWLWTTAARLAAAAFGVLSVVAMWLFAQAMFGRSVANLTVISMAALPIFRMNASDGLSDTPHLTFYLLAAWCAAKGLATSRAGWWAACGVLGGLAFWVRPEGLEVPLVGCALLLATFALRLAPARPTARSLAALAGGVALLVSPYVVLAGKITSKQLPFFKREAVPLFVVTESQEAARLAARSGGLESGAPQPVEPSAVPAAPETPQASGPPAAAVTEANRIAEAKRVIKAPRADDADSKSTASGTLADSPADSALSPLDSLATGSTDDRAPTSSEPAALAAIATLENNSGSEDLDQASVRMLAPPISPAVDQPPSADVAPAPVTMAIARSSGAVPGGSIADAARSAPALSGAAAATASVGAARPVVSPRVAMRVAEKATVAFIKNMVWGFRFAFLPYYLLGNWEMLRRGVPRWTIALAASVGVLHIAALYMVYFLSGYMDQRHVMECVAMALPFAVLGMFYVAELVHRFLLPRAPQPAILVGLLLSACATVIPRGLAPMNTDLQPAFESAAWIHVHALPGDAVICNTPYIPFFGELPWARLDPKTASIDAAIAIGPENVRYEFAVLDLEIEGFKPQWREQIEQRFEEAFRFTSPNRMGREATKVVVYRRRADADVRLGAAAPAGALQ